MPNALYSYGPPVTVGNSPTDDGTPQVNTGYEVEPGTSTSPHTPPANTSTVIGSSGSPSEEMITLYKPVLSTLTPATIAKGSADATVTCTGTGFVAPTSTRAGSVVKVNGVEQVTTFVSVTSVTYQGKHSLQTGAGVLPVVVANNTVESAPQNFTYT